MRVTGVARKIGACMDKGLIIGGIAIPVIGVVALISGTFIHPIQPSNLQECQSFTGELGQFF